MTWYNFIACFFAGAFLANFVPHFVQGVSGEPFPTPFSKPPGRGLSSPLVNVLWALLNLLLGYIVFQFGRISSDNHVGLAIFFAGITALSIPMSVSFAKKHAK